MEDKKKTIKIDGLDFTFRVALNLTKRQLIGFSVAGLIGIPVYLKTRIPFGNDAAVKNISTSVAYYKTGNIEREPGEPQWRKGTISNMLRNKVYIGHLIQGTKYTPTGKKKCHYEIKSKDEWIVVEKAHEPLISEELFNKVQEIMNANRNKNLFKVTKNIKRDPVNRYKGIIYDGNTGLSLLRMPTSNRRNNPDCYYYRFTNKSYDGQFLETPCITVLEQDLDEMVKEKIESSLSVNVNGKNTKAKIIEAANIKIEVINSIPY